MPKLFFRKKNKKPKPSIRDALTPLSAFVAVPNTPPPDSSLPHKQQKFTFSTRPEISAPIPITTDSTDCNPGASQAECVGQYSLVGPGELSGDEDSEAEPGYATVRTGPITNQVHLNLTDDGRQSPMKDVPLPPPPSTSQRHDSTSVQNHASKAQSSPQAGKIVSTSDLPSVSSGLSVHSDSNNSLLLNQGEGHNQDLHIEAKVSVKENQEHLKKKKLSEKEIEIDAMYSKVTKSKKGTGESSPSANRPPMVPRDSPRTKRGKDNSKHNTHNETLNSPRVSDEYGMPSPDQMRSTKKSRSHSSRPQSNQPDLYYEGEGQFTDEDYFPTGDDSISITDNCFDVEEDSQESPPSHNRYVHAHDAPVGHHRSKSVTFPVHRPPVNRRSMSSCGNYRPKKRSTSTSLNVVDGVNSPHDQVPLIQPSFIQPLATPQSEMYIFSERQPDGSLQYFTATPISSPLAKTPPRKLFPPATPSVPVPYQQQQVPTPPIGVPLVQFQGLTESGYFSNVAQPLTSTPSGAMSQQSMQVHARVQSPIVDKSTAPAPTYHTRADSQVAVQTSPPKMSPVPNPAVQSNPSHSFATNGHGEHAGVYEANHSLDQHLKKVQLHSQITNPHESTLKGQIKSLEAANNELYRKNESLRQFQESIKQEASDSAERLQTQVSSLKRKIDNLQDELKRKDWQIDSCKDKISRLREQIERLQEENQLLLSQQQSSMLEHSDWKTVAEHAHSVMDENTSLLRQQQLQREQIKEIKGEHQAIVSQLRGEISKLYKERETLERNLASLKQSHIQLQEQFDNITQQSAKKLSVEEHQQALSEVQELLDELAEKNESDAKSQQIRMRVFEKEKKAFITKLTDAKAIILQLEEECTQVHKANRKAQEKIAELQCELEASRDREVVAHYQLTRAVSHAEKAMVERDTFAKIAKTRKKGNDKVSSVQEAKSGVTVTGIPERSHHTYRYDASHKLDRASPLSRDQERIYKKQRKHYEGEIKHLNALLTKKQDHIRRLSRSVGDGLNFSHKDFY